MAWGVAAGFAGADDSATKAVIGEYQMTMNAVAKKTKADKAQNKAALQKRLAERRCASCPFARSPCILWSLKRLTLAGGRAIMEAKAAEAMRLTQG